jgi:hypothetical protein
MRGARGQFNSRLSMTFCTQASWWFVMALGADIVMEFVPPPSSIRSRCIFP